MKTISIGNQSFSNLRENKYFYIDKTDFIREWWESGDVATLITRPRRFGKTLNMDMLRCFFSNQYKNRSDLFEGLTVWESENYRRIQGSYPVIFLTFAAIKENNFEDTYQQICWIIMDLYKENQFLLDTNILTDQEKELFLSVRPGMDKVTASRALFNLCKYLSFYYGKNVILLIDEYDTPMQEAYVNGYWDEMIQFIRSLFNSTFKTNPYLERGMMTGVTRISKESMFSGLNNLRVITTTSNQYETSFGFTEDEVFETLDLFGMKEKKDKVKQWYNGFTFGKYTDIYNPWSILSLLRERQFDTYWANTSSNLLIDKLLQQGNSEIKETMEHLLLGEILVTQIDEQIVFDQLDDDESAIWSLMLASGYLKIIHSEFPADGNFRYELALTNQEVLLMFQKMIRRWFKNPEAKYNDFIKAFLKNDKKAMNHYMNQVAMQTFSYFDTGNKPSGELEPERFYHGFVLGLMVELNDRYHIISNRESGFGRYDVMLEPIGLGNHSIPATAYVLEFKVYDAEEEHGLQDTVRAALRQIEEKRYDAALIAKGISKDQIKHYGFAFRGKEVLIG